jgi:hypothetical protein
MCHVLILYIGFCYYQTMAAYSKRALLANTFGTLGYVSCMLLWVWVSILYLPLILGNEQVMEILLPSGEKSVVPPEPIAASLGVIIFGLAITVVVMVVTVLVLIRAPLTIARTGKTMTTKAAHSLEPLVVHGRSLPPQDRRRLTVSLIKLVKLLLVLIPVSAGLCTALVRVAVPFEVAMLVCSILALISVFWFSAQYACADILGIKPDKLV